MNTSPQILSISNLWMFHYSLQVNGLFVLLSRDDSWERTGQDWEEGEEGDGNPTSGMFLTWNRPFPDLRERTRLYSGLFGLFEHLQCLSVALSSVGTGGGISPSKPLKRALHHSTRSENDTCLPLDGHPSARATGLKTPTKTPHTRSTLFYKRWRFCKVNIKRAK